MRYLHFSLSMPQNNSWNGKWSGEGKAYSIVSKFRKTAANDDLIGKILANSSYYYNFGDGWGASIDVEEVDAPRAKKLKKNSLGFCGYDWMVSSIFRHQDIRINNGKTVSC